ncbi:MAG TPA: glycosyltransferase [Chthoniobacterales bacterium]|jgi:glycosyltransferase involved in cell wall biosynthesis
MKILHAISSIDPRQGGTSEAVLQLSREAIRCGHTVEIASVDDPSAAWIRDFPLPLHALGPGKTAFKYAPRFQAWLHENVRRFDAVFSHALWQYTGVAVRSACAGQPYFVFPHGMLDPYFDQFRLKRLKKNLFWPWADYRVLRDAKAIFFTSEEELLGAHHSFRSLRGNDRITPLGIDDPPAFSPAMSDAFQLKVPELADRPYLLFLGRIHRKKGCDMLLHAWSKIAAAHPEICLVMAGPDQTGWTSELQTISSERVFWPGMVTGDAKWGALYGAEAFVLPSHQENFGLAVAEALACSTPVLISKKVNIWREITGSHGGFAEDNTPAGTSQLLQRFLALDAVQKASFRTAARATFEKHFRLSAAANLLHTEVARLLHPK